MLSNYLCSKMCERMHAQDSTLAVLRYERDFADDSPDQSECPIRITEFSDAESVEIWQATENLTDVGESGDVRWHRTNNLQFLSISVPLAKSDEYEHITYTAYLHLLEFIKASPLPNLIRFWNYLPFINHGQGEGENYKQFCKGRLSAFSECELTDLKFPAASAVGHYAEGLTICALSTQSTTQHHTNPRQVDAYKYPRQYGSSSPSFARATTVTVGDQELCFISGTASILGHSSVHQGNLQLQIYTTSDNILYLIEEAGFTLSSIRTMRVYLRNPSDYTECKKLVSELFPDANLIFTHADICRSDLLVEIECFCAA